jgi:hypothetical protein
VIIQLMWIKFSRDKPSQYLEFIMCHKGGDSAGKNYIIL